MSKIPAPLIHQQFLINKKCPKFFSDPWIFQKNKQKVSLFAGSLPIWFFFALIFYVIIWSWRSTCPTAFHWDPETSHQYSLPSRIAGRIDSQKHTCPFFFLWFYDFFHSSIFHFCGFFLAVGMFLSCFIISSQEHCSSCKWCLIKRILHFGPASLTASSLMNFLNVFWSSWIWIEQLF